MQINIKIYKNVHKAIIINFRWQNPSTYKIFLIVITSKDVDYIADAFGTTKEWSFPNLRFHSFFGYRHVLGIQTNSVLGIPSWLLLWKWNGKNNRDVKQTTMVMTISV